MVSAKNRRLFKHMDSVQDSIVSTERKQTIRTWPLKCFTKAHVLAILRYLVPRSGPVGFELGAPAPLAAGTAGHRLA